jgi:hypothetical protein
VFQKFEKYCGYYLIPMGRDYAELGVVSGESPEDAIGGFDVF